MSKTYLILGALLAGIGVVLGAFGAHGLKKIVPADAVASYQTGVQYQMYHALALLLVGILSERLAHNFYNYAGVFFLSGILLFSGSIYLITAARAADKVLPKAVFILTPLGGLMFIIGWIFLLVAVMKRSL